MKKILELLFCLVALIALLVCTKYSENVEDVQSDEAIVAANADAQNSNAESVAMLGTQK